MIDFPTVVLKGLVEQRDASAYFGSTMSVGFYRDEAKERGWLTPTGRVSKKGRAVYADLKLAKLPREGRAYTWDWSVTR